MRVRIYFDGGSKNRWVPSAGSSQMERAPKGIGYGSYEIESDHTRVRAKCRVKIGEPATCNEAEYLSFMAGLDHLTSLLRLEQIEPFQVRLEIFSDSMLVVHQVQGRWKVTQEHLKSLRDACKPLLQCFGEWEIYWHSRDNNVKRFGH